MSYQHYSGRKWLLFLSVLILAMIAFSLSKISAPAELSTNMIAQIQPGGQTQPAAGTPTPTACPASTCDEAGCAKDNMTCVVDENGCTGNYCVQPITSQQLSNMKIFLDDKNNLATNWRRQIRDLKANNPGIDTSSAENLVTQWEGWIPALKSWYDKKMENAFWKENRHFDNDLAPSIWDAFNALSAEQERRNLQRRFDKEFPEQISNMQRTIKDLKSRATELKLAIDFTLDFTTIEKALQEYIDKIAECQKQFTSGTHYRDVQSCNNESNAYYTNFWDENKILNDKNSVASTAREIDNRIKDWARYQKETSSTIQDLKQRGASPLDISKLEGAVKDLLAAVAEATTKGIELKKANATDARDFWDMSTIVEEKNRAFGDIRQQVEQTLNQAQQLKGGKEWLVNERRNLNDRKREAKEIGADQNSDMQKLLADYENYVKLAEEDLNNNRLEEYQAKQRDINDLQRTLFDFINARRDQKNRDQQKKDGLNWLTNERRNLSDRKREASDIGAGQNADIQKKLNEYEDHLKMAEEDLNNNLLEDYQQHQREINILQQDLNDQMNIGRDQQNRAQQVKDAKKWLEDRARIRKDMAREMNTVSITAELTAALTAYDAALRKLEDMATTGTIDNSFHDGQRDIDDLQKDFLNLINDIRQSKGNQDDLRNARDNHAMRMKEIKNNERELKRQEKELKTENLEARAKMAEIYAILEKGKKLLEQSEARRYWDEVNSVYEDLNRDFWEVIQSGWLQVQKVNFCRDKSRRVKDLQVEKNRLYKERQSQKFSAPLDFTKLDEVLAKMTTLTDCKLSSEYQDSRDLETDFMDLEQEFRDEVDQYYQAQRFTREREELNRWYEEADWALQRMNDPKFIKDDNLTEQCQSIAKTLREVIPGLIDSYNQGSTPNEEDYRPYWKAYNQVFGQCKAFFNLPQNYGAPEMGQYVDQNFQYIADKEAFKQMLGHVREEILQQVTMEIQKMSDQVLNNLATQIQTLQSGVESLANQVEQNMAQVLTNMTVLQKEIGEKLLTSTTTLSNSLKTFAEAAEQVNKTKPHLRVKLNELEQKFVDHAFYEVPEDLVKEMARVGNTLADETVLESELEENLAKLTSTVNAAIDNDVKKQLKDKVTAFTDAPAHRWFFQYTQSAFNKGIVRGLYDEHGQPLNRIDPNRPTIVAEAVCMFVRPTGGEKPGSTGIASVDGMWAQGCFKGAQEGNPLTIVKEVQKGENPLSTISRGRAFRALAERLGFKPVVNPDTSAFADKNLKNNPDLSYVMALTERGIVQGKDAKSGGKPTLNLDETINRAELLTILMRSLE